MTVMDVGDGLTVEKLVAESGVPIDEIRLVIVNGITHVDRAIWSPIVLKDGDTVALLPNIH